MTTLPPHDWHAPILAALTRAYTGRGNTVRYLEIGIDRGHTIAHIKENVGCEVYGVDITMDNVTAANRKILYPGAHLYQCSSDQFFQMWISEAWRNRIGFDVIFIDGDHNNEQVWKDIKLALSVTKEHGIVAVHDTLPLREEWAASHCGDGYRSIKKLLTSELQVWTMPLFPGLTLISDEYTPLVVEST